MHQQIAHFFRRCGFQPSTLIGLALLVGGVGWLASSSNPTEVRINRLNELIARGQLGIVDPKLKARLDAQFKWLAWHAGARSAIVVNGKIRPHQLTLIVTRPEFVTLTHCGLGNAVFDPALNTIFVDFTLVWPFEVNVIGGPGVNSMYGVADLGYVASYTNFILAHELGHWQAHNKAAAFFYYGWNEGAANLEEEKAADRSAVRTLIAAGNANDEPPALRTANALRAIGLDKITLSPVDRAAADMLGGILLMSYDLLFTSSPFSPYYSDESHPNLLSRVRRAAHDVERTGGRSSLVAETALVRLETERFSALGGWPHRELYLPGPLSVADVRDGALWLGRTDIPDPAEAGPDKEVRLDEHIYRIPLAALSARLDNGTALAVPAPIKVGRSKVGAQYNYAEGFGQWVENEFEGGDPTIQLSPAPPSREPTQAGLGGVIRRVGDVAYEDMGWKWTAQHGFNEGSVAERTLLLALGLPLVDGTPALGRLQWQDGSIAIPTVFRDKSGTWTFRVFLLKSLKPLTLVEQTDFRWTPRSGTIEIGAARFWHGGWWVPTRLDNGHQGDRVELFFLGPGVATSFATKPFLIGQMGAGPPSADLYRLTPENPRFVPITGDRAIFGYDHDSLYLIDAAKRSSGVIFHPAKSGLRIVSFGDGQVMFWMSHARKVYLVDTGGLP